MKKYDIVKTTRGTFPHQKADYSPDDRDYLSLNRSADKSGESRDEYDSRVRENQRAREEAEHTDINRSADKSGESRDQYDSRVRENQRAREEAEHTDINRSAQRSGETRDRFDSRVRENQRAREEAEHTDINRSAQRRGESRDRFDSRVRKMSGTVSANADTPGKFSRRDVIEFISNESRSRKPLSVRRNERNVNDTGMSDGVSRYINEAMETLLDSYGIVSGDRYYTPEEVAGVKGKLLDMRLKGADALSYVRANSDKYIPGADDYIKEIISVLEEQSRGVDEMGRYYKGTDAYDMKIATAYAQGDAEKAKKIATELLYEADLMSDAVEADKLRTKANALYDDFTYGYIAEDDTGETILGKVEALRKKAEDASTERIRNVYTNAADDLLMKALYMGKFSHTELIHIQEQLNTMLDGLGYVNPYVMSDEEMQAALNDVLEEMYLTGGSAGEYASRIVTANYEGNSVKVEKIIKEMESTGDASAMRFAEHLRSALTRGDEKTISERERYDKLELLYSVSQMSLYESKYRERLENMPAEHLYELKRYMGIDTEWEKKASGTHTVRGKQGTVIEAYNLTDAAIRNDARRKLLENGYTEKDLDLFEEYFKYAEDKRKAAEERKFASTAVGNIGGAIGHSLASVPAQLIGGVESIGENIASLFYKDPDKPLNIYSPLYSATRYSNDVRGAVTDKIESNAGKALYNVGMSIADSVFSRLVGAGIGNAATSVAGKFGATAAKAADLGDKVAKATTSLSMSLSSASSSAIDITERGGNKAQAITGGIASGVFEYIFEEFSIENFDFMKEVDAKTAIDWVGNFFKAIGVNASEEGATALGNAIYDYMANGGFSDYSEAVRRHYFDGHSLEEAKKLASREIGMAVAGDAGSGSLQAAVLFAFAGVKTGYNRLRNGTNRKADFSSPGMKLSDAEKARLEELNVLYDNKTIDIQGQVERNQLLEKAGIGAQEEEVHFSVGKASPGIVTKGMTDGERASVLERTTLVITREQDEKHKDELFARNRADADDILDSKSISRTREKFVKCVSAMGAMKEYRKSGISAPFKLSGKGVKKSFSIIEERFSEHKDENSDAPDVSQNRKKDFENAKKEKVSDTLNVFRNLDKVIENAKVIYAADDRYLGKVYPTTNVDTMYVLASAIENDRGGISAVKLEVKQLNNNDNGLYVVASVGDTIKKESYGHQKPGRAASAATTARNLSHSSTISIPQLLENMQTDGENFVKYFPDEMLSPELLEQKRNEIDDERGRTKDKAFNEWDNADEGKWRHANDTYAKAVKTNDKESTDNHLSFARYINDYDVDNEDGTFSREDGQGVAKNGGVTYDDKGNLIPLSERYNKDNPDPNFSLAKSQGSSATPDVPNMSTVDENGVEIVMMNDEEAEVLQAADKWFGIKVRFVNIPGETVEDGLLRYVINGFEKNGTIYINRNRVNPMRFVFGHELTHRLQGTQAYNELRDVVITELKRQYGEDGFNKLVEAKKELYENAGRPLKDNEAVVRELVADWCGEHLFTDEAAIKQLAIKNRGLTQRILDFINELWDKVKHLSESIFKDNVEVSVLDKARKLYRAALVEADRANKKGISLKGDAQHSIYKIDGKYRVYVDSDITVSPQSIDTPKKVKQYILNNFKSVWASLPDGTVFETKIDKTGAGEFAYSEYTTGLKGKTKYDKFRIAANVDEIIQAQGPSDIQSRDHESEQGKKFLAFSHAPVEIQVADRVYECDLVTGINADGESFYDVVELDLIKNNEPQPTLDNKVVFKRDTGWQLANHSISKTNEQGATQSVNNLKNSRDDNDNSMEPFFDDEAKSDATGVSQSLPENQKRSVIRVQNRFTRSIKRTFGFPKKMNMKSFGELVSKMASEYIDSGKITDETYERFVSALREKAQGFSESEIRRRLGRLTEEMRGGLDAAKDTVKLIRDFANGEVNLPQDAAQADGLSHEQKCELWHYRELMQRQHEAALDTKGEFPQKIKDGIDRVVLSYNTFDALFDKQTENYELIKHICEVEKAWRAIDGAVQLIKEGKNQRLNKVADGLLRDFESWKDKKAGVLYSRETMERNIRDIVPDSKRADEIIAEYFEPVHKHEADAVRMRKKFRDRVRDLEISQKVEKGNAVSESFAVQWYGEAMDNIRKLEAKNSFEAMEGGKTLNEWNEAIGEFFKDNPGFDEKRLEMLVGEFQKIYGELLGQMNKVRVEYGYAPIHARTGYFPHFLDGANDSIISQIAGAFGVEINSADALPTTINGMTAAFKPGIKWMPNALERKGNRTVYDAVLGFDNYIQTCSDVVHHTGDIQKLRSLARRIRYNAGDDGLKQEADDIRNKEGLTDEEKDEKIKNLFEKGPYALSNFVSELDEYTNILAGKKSTHDRTIEKEAGRRIYRIVKSIEGRVGANMVAVNPGSWLTNFIPISQAWASIDTKHIMKAMVQTLRSYVKGDVISDASSFLVNRRGDDPLVKSFGRHISEVASKPMEWIDNFTSDVVVRAKYNQLVERQTTNNRSETDIDMELLSKADAFAAACIADRSKGAMPTLFESKNPIFKLFTMFQLEVNNQLSFMFKDLPREAAEEAAKCFGVMLLRFSIGAWIYNEVYEYLFGRRPALDPVDMILDFAGDIIGFELPNSVDFVSKLISDGYIPNVKTERSGIAGTVGNFFGNVSEQLPFISGLVGGGRLPIQSALPNLASLKKAITFNGKPWQSHVYDLYKGISPMAYYMLVPFGGGALKKAIEGTEFIANGGSIVYNSKGEKELQYSISDESFGSFLAEAAKAVAFGKTTTEGGADWVERGFKNLSVKDTVLWGQLIEECGLGRKEAYDTVIESQIGKSEDKSATENKREWLDGADMSDDAKYYIYRAKIASDKDLEIMDSLLDGGFTEGEVYGAVFGMDSLTKNDDEAAYIMGSGLDDGGKFELWYSRVASDNMKEQVDGFISGGMSKDEAYRYMSGLWRAQADAPSGEGKDSMFEALDGMDMKPEDKYEAYYWNIATKTEREMMDMLTDGGLGKAEAYDLTSGFRRADSLKTSEEKQAEKSRLLADSDISDDEKLEIYSNHITSSKKKVSAAEAVLESGGDFDAFLESFGGKADVPAVEFLSVVATADTSDFEKLKLLEGFLDDDDIEAYSKASDAGIGVEEYARYSEDLTRITAKDASGKSVNGLKKQRVLTYIDDMDITDAQKDYLYRELGYSESRIYEAPWRGGRRYEGEIFEGYSEAQEVPSRTPAHSPAERENHRRDSISNKRDTAWREYHNKGNEDDGRNPVIEDAIWGGNKDENQNAISSSHTAKETKAQPTFSDATNETHGKDANYYKEHTDISETGWYNELPQISTNNEWYDELPQISTNNEWYDELPQISTNNEWYNELPKVTTKSEWYDELPNVN